MVHSIPGWTNDIGKRIRAHNSGKGAKYTRGRGPVKLVYLDNFFDERGGHEKRMGYKAYEKRKKNGADQRAGEILREMLRCRFIAGKRAEEAAAKKNRRRKQAAVIAGSAAAAAAAAWTLWADTAVMIHEMTVKKDRIPQSFSGLRITPDLGFSQFCLR